MVASQAMHISAHRIRGPNVSNPSLWIMRKLSIIPHISYCIVVSVMVFASEDSVQTSIDEDHPSSIPGRLHMWVLVSVQRPPLSSSRSTTNMLVLVTVHIKLQVASASVTTHWNLGFILYSKSKHSHQGKKEKAA